MYRSHHQEAEQGEFCTECEVEIERADTTAHQAPPAWSGRHPRSRRTRPRCGLRPVGRASTGSQGHRQTNFACNSIGPNFNKPRKRCNSNDANSIFEQAAGELHAKLTGRQRGRAAVPVGGGGAWPDNESTRRAKLAARAGRRPQAHQAARPSAEAQQQLSQHSRWRRRGRPRR